MAAGLWQVAVLALAVRAPAAMHLTPPDAGAQPNADARGRDIMSGTSR